MGCANNNKQQTPITIDSARGNQYTPPQHNSQNNLASHPNTTSQKKQFLFANSEAQPTSNNPKIMRCNVRIKTTQLVDKNICSLRSQYKPIKKIGEGKYGKIFLVNHLSTNTKRAMKIVSTKMIQDGLRNQIPTEVAILTAVEHHSIVKIYEYFTEGQFYYVVLENVEGSHLGDYMLKTKVDELIIAKLMKSIFSCIIYLHSNNILYRNIEPDNIIVINDALDIKLIGFTSAIYEKNNKNQCTDNLKESIGNYFYMAPETFTGTYLKQSDIWSCGVLLYYLLTGLIPFFDTTSKKVINMIKEGNYNNLAAGYLGLSDSVKDLIEQLLQKDPNLRIDETDILKHPWFIQAYADIPKETPRLSFTHISSDLFKSAIEAFIVHQMENNATIDQLRQVFKTYNQSGDGLISREELRQMINKTFDEKYSDIELNEIMDNIDLDHSGKISFDEFVRVTISNDTLTTKNNLRNAFNFFDKDKSGKLSLGEILEIFDKEDDKKEVGNYVEKLMEKYDKDGDGQLDFEEFVTLISNSK